MEWNRKNTGRLLLVVCAGAAFYAALQHLPAVADAFLWGLGILSPLLLGCAIAFVLNVPMRALERLLRLGKRWERLRRPLSLILTLSALLAVGVLAGAVIGPGVESAAASVIQQIPDALERLEDATATLRDGLPHLAESIGEINVDWQTLSGKAATILQSWGRGLLTTGGGVIGGLVSGVTSFLIGFVFSLYILLQKEKLARQGRQVLYALLRQDVADGTLRVLRLAESTFSHFLSGQCLEALILGTLFTVTMTVFRFPYALLVGVLIAITALVPIVGAFIGCGVGALLIAVTDPWRALWFIVLFLILQQLEGNLIYPHVVGSSVGLPSIWVLSAVTLGGSLLGVVGMLVFIPLCSVLYALFRTFVKRRLEERRVPAEKWREAPKKQE